ncbi:MAG: OsmC family peroxiredoxin [Spirochaetaceae bacterium]|nr:MAG: OsmC family peroxiredoxin [Spirochaetaceae bacterium]
MRVTLERVNDAVHFRATNEQGVLFDIDGSPEIGGTDAGFRPMQLVLAAVASCSAMDVVTILKKQRQRVDDVRIEATGARAEGVYPAPFLEIQLDYHVVGDVDPEKARKAVELGVDKYCSVAEMLRPGVKVKHTCTVLPRNDGAAT